MKHFLKVFSIAFLCFMLAIGAGIFTYFKIYDPPVEADIPDEGDSQINKSPEDNDTSSDDNIDPFKRAINESNRINIVLLGMEGPRTDTIVFASFDPKTKKVNMISLPRDTYFYTKGYEKAGQRKLNAVYGRSGVKGTMNAIENVLGGVPVHHYVRVTYKGVEEIVDSLGGVEVNVPFHMKYEDPTDDPPLYIDIPAGKQTLNGKQAVKFLRFRKSNDGSVGYRDGDLGRVKAQQQFMSSAIKKAFSFRLPSVANTCFNYIRTDMKLTDILLYVKYAYGMKMDDISMTILPGKAQNKTFNGQQLSYFFHDPTKVKELMMDVYNYKENSNENN